MEERPGRHRAGLDIFPHPDTPPTGGLLGAEASGARRPPQLPRCVIRPTSGQRLEGRQGCVIEHPPTSFALLPSLFPCTYRGHCADRHGADGEGPGRGQDGGGAHGLGEESAGPPTGRSMGWVWVDDGRRGIALCPPRNCFLFQKHRCRSCRAYPPCCTKSRCVRPQFLLEWSTPVPATFIMGKRHSLGIIGRPSLASTHRLRPPSATGPSS